MNSSEAWRWTSTCRCKVSFFTVCGIDLLISLSANHPNHQSETLVLRFFNSWGWNQSTHFNLSLSWFHFCLLLCLMDVNWTMVMFQSGLVCVSVCCVSRCESSECFTRHWLIQHDLLRSWEDVAPEQTFDSLALLLCCTMSWSVPERSTSQYRKWITV